MVKKCISCESRFDGRKDAKTCSAKCRKKLQRHRDAIEVVEAKVESVKPSISVRARHTKDDSKKPSAKPKHSVELPSLRAVRFTKWAIVFAYAIIAISFGALWNHSNNNTEANNNQAKSVEQTKDKTDKLDLAVSSISGQLAQIKSSVAEVKENTNTDSGSNSNSSSSDDSDMLGGQLPGYYNDADNLTGSVSDSLLSDNVALQDGDNTFSSTSNVYYGDGAHISNVDAITLQGNSTTYFTNATNLSSGTIADARLSTNVVLLDQDQTFGTGTTQTFDDITITGTCTGCPGAGSTTLDQAYAAGVASAIITLDSTRDGVIIKDNATPTGGDLFTVQSNAGTKFLNVTSSGASVAGTLSATAFSGPLTGNVTGNVSGSSGSTTGNAATATALQNARTIGGVSFDGTGNITVSTATGGFTVSGGDLAIGSNNLTITGSIGSTGARSTKGWFVDLQVTNAISGSVTGNAGTVTNGIYTTDTGSVTSTIISDGTIAAGDIASGAVTAVKLQSAAADLGAGDVTVNFGNTNGAFNTNITTDGTITATSGFFGNLTGAVTGNASSATALAANPDDCSAGQFATTIAASGNLTCSAVGAGDLSGATLNSGVTASSLTSVGTLSGLTAAGTININTSGSSNTNIGTTTSGGTITIGGASGSDLVLQDANWGITGAGAITATSLALGFGNITTSGTYNSNTFTSSALTFGAASTATIQSAASRALDITAHGTSAWTTDNDNLTIDATEASATLSIGTGNAAKTVQVGSTNASASLTLQGGSGITLANATTVSNNLTIGAQADATSSYSTLNSSTGAFGSQTNVDGVSSEVVFNGKVFVATREANGAGVYRYDGGTTWTLVTNSAGKAVSGDAANIDAYVMAVYNNALYIGSQTGSGTGTGCVYYSSTADTTADTFSSACSAAGSLGMSQTAIDGISSLAVLKGQLFVSTQLANLWEWGRYNGGTSWTQINATDGKVAAEATTDIDGAVLLPYGSRMYLGLSTGADNTARIAVTDIIAGNSSNPVILQSTNGSFGGVASNSDINSMIVWNGTIYFTVSKTAGNALLIVQYQPSNNLTTATNSNFVNIGNAAGKVISTDSNIDTGSLYVYGNRLYVATNNGSGDNAGALYYFEGMKNVSGTTAYTWTKVGTAGTFGSETSVDGIDSIFAYNGTMYVGTTESNSASVYAFTQSLGQSYNLVFAGGSTGNVAMMGFNSNAEASASNGKQGAFFFTNSVALTSGAFDYAEDYPTTDTTLEPGEPVSVDPSYPEYVKRAQPGETILGVVSKNPGLRLSSQAPAGPNAEWIPIALTGRVPVKVTTANGEILPGDSLELSEISGVLQKATGSGQVAGTALSGYNGNGIGEVSLFVSPTWKYVISGDVQGLSSTNNSGLTDTNIASVLSLGESNTEIQLAQNTTIADGKTFTAKGISLFQGDADNFLAIQTSGGENVLNVDTSNAKVTIGSSSSSPVLLVLASKTTLGDPACVAGAIYYNSATNDFRGCADQAWVSLGSYQISKTSSTEVGGSQIESDLLGGEGRLAAGVLLAGKSLEANLSGDMLYNAATGATARIKVTLCGSTIYDSGISGSPINATYIEQSSARKAWNLNMKIQALSSSSQYMSGVFTVGGKSSGASVGLSSISSSGVVTNLISSDGATDISTAGSCTLAVTAQWSDSDPALSIKLRSATIRVQ